MGDRLSNKEAHKPWLAYVNLAIMLLGLATACGREVEAMPTPTTPATVTPMPQEMAPVLEPWATDGWRCQGDKDVNDFMGVIDPVTWERLPGPIGLCQAVDPEGKRLMIPTEEDQVIEGADRIARWLAPEEVWRKALGESWEEKLSRFVYKIPRAAMSPMCGSSNAELIWGCVTEFAATVMINQNMADDPQTTPLELQAVIAHEQTHYALTFGTTGPNATIIVRDNENEPGERTCVVVEDDLDERGVRFTVKEDGTIDPEKPVEESLLPAGQEPVAVAMALAWRLEQGVPLTQEELETDPYGLYELEDFQTLVTQFRNQEVRYAIFEALVSGEFTRFCERLNVIWGGEPSVVEGWQRYRRLVEAAVRAQKLYSGWKTVPGTIIQPLLMDPSKSAEEFCSQVLEAR